MISARVFYYVGLGEGGRTTTTRGVYNLCIQSKTSIGQQQRIKTIDGKDVGTVISVCNDDSKTALQRQWPIVVVVGGGDKHDFDVK